MEQFSPQDAQDVAETVISSTAMRIVKLLVGNEPRTIADLVDETGVTRTAVTEQLNELVAGGFVEKTTERVIGRGRRRSPPAIPRCGGR